MKDDSGATRPIWADAPPLHAHPRLAADTGCDVCVVGAGITGLGTAWHLAQAGLDVVVIDDGPVAGGETARTTAHLTQIPGRRYHWLAKVHGGDAAATFAAAHGAAIDAIEARVREDGIECGFERLDAYLFQPADGDEEELEPEWEAARAAGLAGIAWADRAPLADFDTGRCLRLPRQAQFHPLLYLDALERALVKRGARIHRDTRAHALDDGPPLVVETAAGPRIRAGTVVVATNSPFHMKLGVHTKQGPFRTYAVAFAVERRRAARALYYDTPLPYHYVRFHTRADGGEVLIVGGEDHRTGTANDATRRWTALEAWSRERFPEAGRVLTRWSGQVFEPADGVAFIGRDPERENVLLATGDAGMGMTHGTIAAELLTALALGREHRWEKLFDPARKPVRAAAEALKSLAEAAKGLAGHLTPGDASSADQIPAGGGAVLRRGTKKVAVYREPGGTLHHFDAACTHLGCPVSWNAAEQSWDCECHGSRFDACGRVLTGPASRDLERVKDESRR